MLAFNACTVLRASSAPEILSQCDTGLSFADATELKRWMNFPLDVYIDVESFPEAQRGAYRDGVENVLSQIRRRDEAYFRLRYTF